MGCSSPLQSKRSSEKPRTVALGLQRLLGKWIARALGGGEKESMAALLEQGLMRRSEIPLQHHCLAIFNDIPEEVTQILVDTVIVFGHG